MNPKIWWYAARASGIVAWGLAAASVIWGLVLSTRSARQRMRPVWVLDLHRYLGALTVVAVGVHLGALVADSFVPFGWADLFVPGASAWRTVPVAFGVVAFWLLVAVEVSSLLRPRLSKRLWSRIHLLSFAVYALATLHYLQAGTERTNPILLLVVEATTAVVLGLTLLRLLAPRPARRVRPAQRDTGRSRDGEWTDDRPAHAGPPVDDADLLGSLHREGLQRAVPHQPRQGPDRAVDRLRPAHPDRLRQR